jgi:hypothetical protein
MNGSFLFESSAKGIIGVKIKRLNKSISDSLSVKNQNKFL